MQQPGADGETKVAQSPIERTVNQLGSEIPDLDRPAAQAHMALSRAYAVYSAALAARYETLGLSVPRFNTLRWLYHADTGRLTISELSAHLEASLPTVMRMVRVLEQEGWIRRWDSEYDRRVTLVELTDSGRERFSEILKRAAGIWSEIWSDMPREDKERLAALLSQLRANLLSRYIGHESLLPYKLGRIESRKDGEGYAPGTPA